MERISTRCGFCGRQTMTRHGRCPECGRIKRPPAPMPEPPAPPSMWREMSAQIGAAALAVLLVVVALVIGSTLLLYGGLLFLCAVVVISVVASGVL
jgi:rRNA maturation protein Nop10